MPATKNTPATRKKAKAPAALADIRKQMQTEAESIKDRIGSGGVNKIKLRKDKQFELPDGTTCEELEVVIVEWTARNNFYDGKYDPKNPTPPVCYAVGPDFKSLIPAENVTDKQADSCAECPNNVFGSDGNGKACKNQRRLAILPADATEETEFMTMDVSPTALKYFDKYVGKLSREFSATPIAVTTLLTFDQTVEHQTLMFAASAENENLALHWSRREEARELIEQPVDYDAFESKAPATATKRKAPARKARR